MSARASLSKPRRNSKQRCSSILMTTTPSRAWPRFRTPHRPRGSEKTKGKKLDPIRKEDCDMADVFPQLDYKPTLPRNLERGIGIIGAGGIVNYARLPAYKRAGFKVAGVTDKNLEAAEKTARDHGIPKVHANVDDLLKDPQIEIVDIAVYRAAKAEIVEKAAAAGKHMLCQKPFADEFSKAVRNV